MVDHYVTRPILLPTRTRLGNATPGKRDWIDDMDLVLPGWAGSCNRKAEPFSYVFFFAFNRSAEISAIRASPAHVIRP